MNFREDSKNDLIPWSCIIDNKIASAYSIEDTFQKAIDALKTAWLLLPIDGGSNSCLFTAVMLMYNLKEHDGIVNGTSGGKSKVTVVDESRVKFHLYSRSIKVTIERSCVIPSNKDHTLDLALFL